MKTSRFIYLFPPNLSGYEETQKAKILHYMLLAAIAGSLIIGIVNLLSSRYLEATFLFAFTGFSLIGFFLNHTQYSWYAGLILNISMFVVICLMMFNGSGLYDETVLVFPFFIIITTFMFGKRGLWTGTCLSVAAIIGFYYLQMYGLFESKYMASATRVFILSSLGSVLGTYLGAYEIISNLF